MNHNNVLDLIGNTPLLRIDGVNVKQEFLNPSGSIKDRIAKYIVEKAEKSGKLKKGYTIVEATTGNTGIAFSMVAAIKGYNMLVVMPQGLSEEREEIIKSYGANIHFVKEGCVTCAVEVAKKLARKKGYFMPNQFSNPLNIEENEKLLGQEIPKHLICKKHKIEGIGDGFIPKIINDNKKLIDFVIRVKSEDAINETKR